MGLLKKILRTGFVTRLSCHLIHGYLAFVFRTTRWTFVGFDAMERRVEAKEGFFVAVWHERLAMTALGWNKTKGTLTILTSAHPDGQIVARVMNRFGIAALPVSSKEANIGIAKSVARIIKQGDCVGITPDGPRGPRRVMKDMPILWSRLANADITVCGYSVRWKFTIGTWDRFVVPLPFSRGVYIWRDALRVPKKTSAEDVERLRTDLEKMLTDLTDECDELVKTLR